MGIEGIDVIEKKREIEMTLYQEELNKRIEKGLERGTLGSNFRKITTWTVIVGCLATIALGFNYILSTHQVPKGYVGIVKKMTDEGYAKGIPHNFLSPGIYPLDEDIYDLRPQVTIHDEELWKTDSE